MNLPMKQTTNRSIITFYNFLRFCLDGPCFSVKNHWIYKLLCRFHCKDPGWNQSYLWVIGSPTSWWFRNPAKATQLRWRIYHDLNGGFNGTSQSRVVVWDFFHQYRGVSKNSGFSPQIIHFNRVFHCFHHPFGVFPPIFGNTQIWIHKDFGRMTSDSAVGFFCFRSEAPRQKFHQGSYPLEV